MLGEDLNISQDIYAMGTEVFLPLSFAAWRTGECELDVIIFSAAISACEKPGRWLSAVRLLRSMQQRRVSPNEAKFFDETAVTFSPCLTFVRRMPEQFNAIHIDGP